MITKVVGVTFSNEDGSSRTRIIEGMSESDTICLERDPYNQYDSNAVKVCVIKNGEKKQIGFLAKLIASDVSPKLRRGVNYDVTIMGCGVWNDRPFCELNITEIAASAPTTSSAPSPAAPRPVAPQPAAPVPPRPAAPVPPRPAAPATPRPAAPVTPRPAVKPTVNPRPEVTHTPSSNSGCLGFIVVAVIILSAIAAL